MVSMARRRTATVPPHDPDVRRSDRELLADLGLKGHASSRDVESAHDGIVAFLETAPVELRSWAGTAAAAADEAYALLADPTSRSAAANEEDGPRAGEPAEAGPADEETPPAAPGLLAGLRGNPRRRHLAVALGVAAAIAVVVGVYRMGGGSTGQEAAQPAATQASSGAQVDPSKVAALMQKVATSPASAAPLIQLGDLYFQAGDYASAADWMGRAVKLRPGNATARLALGAAWFNLGRRTNAEREWRRVVAANPKSVEAHYDLGFLYLSANPPDKARVRAEWGKVVALAPKSDVAKTVAAHLGQLGAPSAAPAPGGK